MTPEGLVGPLSPEGLVGPLSPEGLVEPLSPEGLVGPMTPEGLVGPLSPEGLVRPLSPEGLVGPMSLSWSGIQIHPENVECKKCKRMKGCQTNERATVNPLSRVGSNHYKTCVACQAHKDTAGNVHAASLVACS